MADMLTRAAASLRRSIQLLVGRAVLAAVNDEGGRQFIQIKALKGEDKDRIQRVQNYGFTSNPHDGAEVVIVCVGGNRDHAIAIGVDDPKYRMCGTSRGEVAIYTDEGDHVYLKRGRVVEVNTETLLVKASGKARFETPTLEVVGQITDLCDSDGVSMSSMRETYDTHTHQGGSGGETGEPNQPMGGGV